MAGVAAGPAFTRPIAACGRSLAVFDEQSPTYLIDATRRPQRVRRPALSDRSDDVASPSLPDGSSRSTGRLAPRSLRDLGGGVN
jgi:hypothetical protein